jgi:hypothetical protein
MRSIPSLLLGGLFCTIAFASCGTPETNPGPDAPAIDGLQACIDAHVLYIALCDSGSLSGAEEWCNEYFKNGGPACRDAFSIEWACKRDALQDAAACLSPMPCQRERGDWMTCVNQYGCWMPPAPCDGYVDPNGCTCSKECFEPDVHYKTDCKPNGMTWICDCYSGPLPEPMQLAGTCDQGGPFCDAHVELSCCNQFFMLSF